MYKGALVTLLIWLISIQVYGQYNNTIFDKVYPKSEVSRIDVFMDPDSLAIMLEDIFTEHKYPSYIIFSNSQLQDTIQNVGIRIRGNTSQSSAKKSFKLSFNAFEKGGDFKGYEHFNLNGEHNDPSIMRSKLCWDILQNAEFPAPKASFVELYFNNEFRGLYINVEHIDEQFAKSRFSENDGNLYKCTYPSDLHYKGEDPDLYKESFWGKRAYELKTNEEEDDYSDLAHFIDVLNNTSAEEFICEIQKVFNVDHYLVAMAIDIITGNWDGPLYNKNNFYLYHNQCTGKFEYIPYDLDNTFGIDWFGIDWTQRNIYEWGHSNEYRPLFEKIIEQDEYRDQLSTIISSLLQDECKPSYLKSEIDAYKVIIEDLVVQDPYYPLDYGFDISSFNTSFNSGLGGHVPFGLKEYIDLRTASAFNQLSLNDPAPLSYFIDFTYADKENEGIVFKCKVWDQPISQLKLFTKKAGENWTMDLMNDEGANGDLIAGDLLYTSIMEGWEYGQDIEYYVEITSPDSKTNRYPECDYLLVDLSTLLPTLHLNEWMASNKSTIADESGSFPDWIEIYNSGVQPIYLGDKYLSDDVNDRTKFKMPDVVIYPGQFLLFWADNDEEEGPYHTNFKLGAAGESIRIYDSKEFDFREIDGVDYGPQTEDISEGLLTDGGETIVFFTEPTPKASNEPVGVAEIPNFDFMISPNPAYSYIQIGLNTEDLFDVEVFSVGGNSLLKEKGISRNSRLVLDGIPSGTYYIKVIDKAGGIGIQKFIVLR